MNREDKIRKLQHEYLFCVRNKGYMYEKIEEILAQIKQLESQPDVPASLAERVMDLEERADKNDKMIQEINEAIDEAMMTIKHLSDVVRKLESRR